MRQLFLLLLMASPPFAGRWDLTITTPNDTYPSWMEVAEKDGSSEVHVVGRVASVHSVTDTKLEGSHLSFTSSEWFGKPLKVTWEMSVAGGKLTGIQNREDGVKGQLTGVRAPALKRKAPAAWSNPEALFNGNDLTGWVPDNPAENHWKAQGGELVNEKAGANIQTTREFDDFKLHIEYNCPQMGTAECTCGGAMKFRSSTNQRARTTNFMAWVPFTGSLLPRPP